MYRNGKAKLSNFSFDSKPQLSYGISFLSVLLRNVEPKDEGKYSKRQILAQFADIGLQFVKQDEEARVEVFSESAMGIMGRTLKWLWEECFIDDFGDEDEKTVIDIDNFFTVFLQAHIKNQSIAISALKVGLTLNGEHNIFLCVRFTHILIPNFFHTGSVNLQFTLASTSLSYVSEKLFVEPTVNSSDLFERLVLSRRNFSDLHQPFLGSIMKDVITEMTPKEREDFLFFCTGFNYLPRRDSKFFITVEFDYENMTFTSLPVSHICENTLVLPSDMYGKDRMIFKAKLCRAI